MRAIQFTNYDRGVGGPADIYTNRMVEPLYPILGLVYFQHCQTRKEAALELRGYNNTIFYHGRRRSLLGRQFPRN